MNTRTFTVVICSTNDAKMSTVITACEKLAISIAPISLETKSGVSDQPMSYKEALRGVRNRISHAKAVFPKADFFIAIESGIRYDRLLKLYFDFSYTCIQDVDGLEAISKSVEFEIPKDVMKHVLSGDNLSIASTKVFGIQDVGKTIGISGILSEEHIPRPTLHLQPTIFALCKFFTKHKKFQ